MDTDMYFHICQGFPDNQAPRPPRGEAIAFFGHRITRKILVMDVHLLEKTYKHI